VVSKSLIEFIYVNFFFLALYKSTQSMDQNRAHIPASKWSRFELKLG